MKQMSAFYVADEPVFVVQPEGLPEDTFEGPEFHQYRSTQLNNKTSRSLVKGTHSQVKKVQCTVCMRETYANFRHHFEHPVLHVIVCKDCHSFYNSGTFLKDDNGIDEHCRWCADGGDVVMCDNCTNVFCKVCITKNCSPEDAQQILESSNFVCFVCDPTPINSKVLQCKSLFAALKKKDDKKEKEHKKSRHNKEKEREVCSWQVDNGVVQEKYIHVLRIGIGKNGEPEIKPGSSSQINTSSVNDEVSQTSSAETSNMAHDVTVPEGMATHSFAESQSSVSLEAWKVTCKSKLSRLQESLKALNTQCVNQFGMVRQDDAPWSKFSALKVVQDLKRESAGLNDALERFHASVCKIEEELKANTSTYAMDEASSTAKESDVDSDATMLSTPSRRKALRKRRELDLSKSSPGSCKKWKVMDLSSNGKITLATDQSDEAADSKTAEVAETDGFKNTGTVETASDVTGNEEGSMSDIFDESKAKNTRTATASDVAGEERQESLADNQVPPPVCLNISSDTDLDKPPQGTKFPDSPELPAMSELNETSKSRLNTGGHLTTSSGRKNGDYERRQKDFFRSLNAIFAKTSSKYKSPLKQNAAVTEKSVTPEASSTRHSSSDESSILKSVGGSILSPSHLKVSDDAAPKTNRTTEKNQSTKNKKVKKTEYNDDSSDSSQETDYDSSDQRLPDDETVVAAEHDHGKRPHSPDINYAARRNELARECLLQNIMDESDDDEEDDVDVEKLLNAAKKNRDKRSNVLRSDESEDGHAVDEAEKQTDDSDETARSDNDILRTSKYRNPLLNVPISVSDGEVCKSGSGKKRKLREKIKNRKPMKRRKLNFAQALADDTLSDEDRLLLNGKSIGASGFYKSNVKVILSDLKFDSTLKHLLQKAKEKATTSRQVDKSFTDEKQLKSTDVTSDRTATNSTSSVLPDVDLTDTDDRSTVVETPPVKPKVATVVPGSDDDDTCLDSEVDGEHEDPGLIHDSDLELLESDASEEKKSGIAQPQTLQEKHVTAQSNPEEIAPTRKTSFQRIFSSTDDEDALPPFQRNADKNNNKCASGASSKFVKRELRSSDEEITLKSRKMKRGLSSSDDDAGFPTFSRNRLWNKSTDFVKKEVGSGDDFRETRSSKTKRRRRIVMGDSGSASDDVLCVEPSPQKSKRRNIRKILDDNLLSQETQDAERMETERMKRLEEHDDLEEEVIIIEDDSETPTKKITTRLVLSKKPLVEVDPALVRVLKPHQVEGVKFIWKNVIEDVARANRGKGDGCILAHCMGLGKTLQVVTFLHAVLHSSVLPKLKTALVLCPLGTITNWVREFAMWTGGSKKKIVTYDLSTKSQQTDNHSRSMELRKWKKLGGVMIISYGLYRRLCGDKDKHSSTYKSVFVETLREPGPDIVVCDEGHVIKNNKTNLAATVNQIKTRRRIILTGTPLQNNLMEYHCMVSFIKKRLLGSASEFANRFANPIKNGQHNDSTKADVHLMKKRSHILHKLLAGCVQRKDIDCLRQHLKPKSEYVLFVRMSPMQHLVDDKRSRLTYLLKSYTIVSCDQVRLYETYLERCTDMTKKSECLFSNFNELLLVVCHPRAVVLSNQKRGKKETQESFKRFVNDDDDCSEIEEEDDDCGNEEGGMASNRNIIENLSNMSNQELKKLVKEKGGDVIGIAERKDLIEYAKSLLQPVAKEDSKSPPWFESVMPAQDQLYKAVEQGGKIVLLLEILDQAAMIGDKVVVFSQSLLTLNVIEDVLEEITKEREIGKKPHLDCPHWRWYKNVDYFRMDGSTQPSTRRKYIEQFNSESDTRGRLFLVSTRAGGIGVNLIGANRAIVFDACWNPTHDVQSIFRIYRFGQTKPCYVYRFIAQGTMEEKIYDRQAAHMFIEMTFKMRCRRKSIKDLFEQTPFVLSVETAKVVKQSLAYRVIDEQQIERHFTADDISELYTFKPDRLQKNSKDALRKLPPPKDKILAELLSQSSTCDAIVKYHEHDSLLDHQVEEELSEAERRIAWDEYDIERRKPITSDNPFLKMAYNDLRGLVQLAETELQKNTQMLDQCKDEDLDMTMLKLKLCDRSLSPDRLQEMALQTQIQRSVLRQQLTNTRRFIVQKLEQIRQCLRSKKPSVHSNVHRPPTSEMNGNHYNHFHLPHSGASTQNSRQFHANPNFATASSRGQHAPHHSRAGPYNANTFRSTNQSSATFRPYAGRASASAFPSKPGGQPRGQGPRFSGFQHPSFVFNHPTAPNTSFAPRATAPPRFR